MDREKIWVKKLRKIIRAGIIAVSCFFIGLLLAALSPLIGLLALIAPTKKKPPLSDRWEKSIKKFEEKLKEASDPDYGEPWKKRHMDLYGSEDE
jgi:hypothetical protein